MDNIKLKGIIGELIKEIESEKELEEMTGTGAVAGYNTPAAFTRPGKTKEKNNRLAKVTGGEVVNDLEESVNEEFGSATNLLQLDPEKYKSTATKAGKEDDKDSTMADVSDMELAEGGAHKMTENRWLDIKREDASPKLKVARGIGNIKNQLAEIEKFVNWYSKIKNESGLKREDYYLRTNKHLRSIRERLMNITEKMRGI